MKSAALALLLICTPAFGATVQQIASPAGAGSAQAFIASTHDGALLSWLQPVAGTDRIALRISRYRAGAWAPPRTVVERNDLLANWADFPSVIEDAKGILFAHWLRKSGSHSYDIWMSASSDDGKTWREPFLLNHDGRKAEHGFVSLAPLPGGGVAVTWLDGRKMKEGTEEGEMTLRYATIDARGAVHGEMELDGRACDCCTTGMAVAGSKPVIAYRDRSSDEIRDIAVMHPGAKSAIVHADGWKINGCPVNGPQIAASTRTVATAWFTAANGHPRVYAAFSTNGGATFAAPIAVDEGKPIGRAGIVMLDDNTAVVSWLEEKEVRVRVVSRSGKPAPSIRVADSAGGRAAGFPRIARVGRDVLIAWNDPKGVQVATIKP